MWKLLAGLVVSVVNGILPEHVERETWVKYRQYASDTLRHVEQVIPRDAELVVVSIFKNDCSGWVEWIEHHLNQGVDFFLMFDNNSTDVCPKAKASYADKVAVVQYPVNYKQRFGFNLAVKVLKQTVPEAWVAIFDLDEFAYGTRSSLKAAIKQLTLSKRSPPVAQVCAPWIMYVSDGREKQPDCLSSLFTLRASYDEPPDDPRLVKCITKLSKTAAAAVHRYDVTGMTICSDGSQALLGPKACKVSEKRLRWVDLWRINHYPAQSNGWVQAGKPSRRSVVSTKRLMSRDVSHTKSYNVHSSSVVDDSLARISVCKGVSAGEALDKTTRPRPYSERDHSSDHESRRSALIREVSESAGGEVSESLGAPARITESSHSFLFHKAILGVADPHAPMNYRVVQRASINKHVVAHLHTHDLGDFESVYGPYIDVLLRFTDIVVTYCLGADTSLQLVPAANVIRIINKGMDVGAKFCAVDFLLKQHGRTAFVLFLHSKSDPKQRFRYFEWYLSQLPYLPKNTESKLGGVFNPYLVFENPGWGRNIRYMRDLIRYFGLENDFYAFPEGNCFILSWSMARTLYSDSRVYQMLNTNTSIDVPWVLQYHGLDDDKPFARNNLQLGKGHDGLADGMLEHAFERLPFLMLRKYEMYGAFNLVASRAANLTLHPPGRKFEQPLTFDDADLRAKFFTKGPTKFDRVAVLAVHTSDTLALTIVHNNLLYLSQIVGTILLVYSSDAPFSIKAHLDDSPYRHLFIIDNTLSDAQCMWYASHLDLPDHSLEWLRQHYALHGHKEKRFLPHVIAKIFMLPTTNTQYLCHHKWHLALTSNILNLDDFTDFILVNDSFLICRSLIRFSSLFREHVEMTAFVSTLESESNDIAYMRRYNRKGVEKIRNYYTSKIKLNQNITHDQLVEELDVGSKSIFESVSAFHETGKDADGIHYTFPDVEPQGSSAERRASISSVPCRQYRHPRLTGSSRLERQ